MAENIAMPSRTLTMRGTTVIAKTRNSIPTKFRVTAENFAPEDFTKSISTQAPNTAPEPCTTLTSLQHAEHLQPLPQVPTWMLHVLVGAISFVLIAAILLFIAQFPPRFRWRWSGRNWRRGYMKVNDDEDHDDEYDTDDDTRLRGRSSALAHGLPINDEGLAQPDSLRRRRAASGLRLSTDVGRRQGLAVRMSGTLHEDEQAALRTPHKRRSFDEERLRFRPRSPVITMLETFTAPLPSVKTFVRTPEKHARDVETGLHEYSPSSPEFFSPQTFLDPDRYSTPSSKRAGCGRGSPGAALFKKINGGIADVADRLSRTLYNQVNAPKDGLLLPVHDSEREQPRAQGVFVDI